MVINYVIDAEAEVLAKEIIKNVGSKKVMKFKANVSDREQVRSMFDATIEKIWESRHFNQLCWDKS